MSSTLQDIVKITAFVADHESEALLREAIPTSYANSSFRRGGLKTAIEAMQNATSPDIIIIDVSDCELDNSVLKNLEILSDFVEPNTVVLAMGSSTDVDFYRQITRSMGVSEYISKPITRDQIARHFMPVVIRDKTAQGDRGGRVIGFTGMKGGVGTTMILAGVARYIGVDLRRHTVVVDTDMRNAACAMYLGAKPPNGLRTAMGNSRVDLSYMNRIAEAVDERLAIIGNDERRLDDIKFEEGAAIAMIDALRYRYNFVLIDLSDNNGAMNAELLNLVHHRIAVMDPSVVALREANKVLNSDLGRSESQRPTIVLNRAGIKGGLTRDHIVNTGEVKVDIEIPEFNPGPLNMLNLGRSYSDSFKGLRDGVEQIAAEIGATNKILEAKKSGFDNFMRSLGIKIFD